MEVQNVLSEVILLLAKGSKAPDFTAPSTKGTITLSQIKGTKILIFYPKDRTPG